MAYWILDSAGVTDDVGDWMDGCRDGRGITFPSTTNNRVSAEVVGSDCRGPRVSSTDIVSFFQG
jgi:hypothetical protein